MTDTLVNVKADTALDFIEAAHKAMNDDSKLGETKAEVSWKTSTDGKTKKLKTVVFTLKTEIRRVHWAGQAKAKPDKENLAAITKIEKLNKAHEEAHRAGYTAEFKKLKTKLEKELVGKDEDELEKAAKQINKALKDTCEKLHKSGGDITVTENGGKVTVKEGPEGSGGCTGFD